MIAAPAPATVPGRICRSCGTSEAEGARFSSRPDGSRYSQCTPCRNTYTPAPALKAVPDAALSPLRAALRADPTARGASLWLDIAARCDERAAAIAWEDPTTARLLRDQARAWRTLADRRVYGEEDE